MLKPHRLRAARHHLGRLRLHHVQRRRHRPPPPPGPRHRLARTQDGAGRKGRRGEPPHAPHHPLAPPPLLLHREPDGRPTQDGLHAGHTAPPDNLLSVRLHLPLGPPTSGRTTRSPSSCRRAGTATPATSRHPVAPGRDCRAYRTGHCARHILRSCASTSSASANGTSTASRCPSAGTSTPSRPCSWSCFEHGLTRIDTNYGEARFENNDDCRQTACQRRYGSMGD